MQTYPSGCTTPTEYYYTQDLIGSTIAITDSTGANAATYTYDSWGNTTAATGGTTATTTNPWRYAAGYTDPNGTIKFGARYYNPTIGRLNQRDPSGQSSGYVYAGNNPISQTDPTGLYVYVPSDYKYDPDLGSLHDYCTKSPDQYIGISGVAGFQGPRAYHDECYGNAPGGDLRICDLALRANLYENCDDTFSFFNLDRYACHDVADI